MTRPDEVILNEGDFEEAAVLEIVETAHRAGVKVRIAPKTTDLLLQRGEAQRLYDLLKHAHGKFLLLEHHLFAGEAAATDTLEALCDDESD